MSKISQSQAFYKVIEGADRNPIFNAEMSEVLLRDKKSKLQNICLEIWYIYFAFCCVSIDTTKSELCLINA